MGCKHGSAPGARLRALAALAVTGCATVDPVTTEDQALYGGVETTARPEVGMFGRPCTAVLVDSQHVLTAAHCLGNYQDVAIRQSDGFSPGSPNGPAAFGAQRHGVRIYSWGNHLAEHTNTGWMSTDLALMRLDSRIAPEEALPAGITRFRPDDGAPVTAIGLGCTSTMGWGTKNAYTYPFYTEGSRVQCGGDSGGARVFGNLYDGGPLWGIMSGRYDAGAKGWDFFGDANWVKPYVELLIRKWNAHDLQFDMDRPGLDYAAAFAGDAVACRSMCWAEPSRCMAFSYVIATNTCWLKEGLADWYPRIGVVSGVSTVRSYPFERRVDRPGRDYTNFEPATPSVPQECATACARDVRCRAFTYFSPTAAGGNGRCYLKEEVPDGVSNVNAESGVKLGLEIETDRPGADYSNYSTYNQPEYCQADCARDAVCQAWTWVGAVPGVSNAWCWLKTALPSPRDSVAPGSARTISGIKGREFL